MNLIELCVFGLFAFNVQGTEYAFSMDKINAIYGNDTKTTIITNAEKRGVFVLPLAVDEVVTRLSKELTQNEY